MSHAKNRENGPRGGITRRESLLAGLALLGGGFTAQGFFSTGTDHRPGPGERDPEDILSLPDRDLLCLADSILDRPVAPGKRDETRRILLRILAASLDFPSQENDRLAARVIAVLGREGWITPAAAGLVRSSTKLPAARASLRRALAGNHRKEGA